MVVVGDAATLISVLLGNGDGSFKNSTQDISQSTFEPLLIKDFTGDSINDIVIYSGDDIITFLPGKGDGTFHAPITLDIGDYVYQLYAANVDGDALTDLIVSDGYSTHVWHNNGNGTFNKLNSYSGGCIATKDINGDGRDDLIVMEQNSLKILMNNGSGAFTAGRNHFAGKIDSAYGNDYLNMHLIITGDFNNDNKIDIAYTYSATKESPTVSIVMGNSEGFATPLVNPLNTKPADFAVGDLNGDNIIDVVTIEDTGVAVYLGAGDGTFNQGAKYQIGSSLRSCLLGDFNEDGRPDLIIFQVQSGNYYNNYYLEGKGDGTFKSPVNFFSYYYTTNNYLNGDSAVGDFNGDGHLDITVVQSFGMRTFSGNGDGTFREAGFYEVSGSSITALDSG